MQTILIGVTALLLSFNASAAALGDPVPAAVLAAFQQQFPDVKKARWDKEGDVYEAEFKRNGVETSATFSASGQLLETETTIAVSALPQAARDYVAANFKGKKIKEAAKITKSNGEVIYEAEVKRKDLLFNASGQFLEMGK